MANLPKTIEVNVRPTLVMGLGGTGAKIAVQLKARLEERFGKSSGYDRVIKFLCFDTANEIFSALQPNHPERPAVTLVPHQEFIRISEVPLHDIIASQSTNPAIAEILPELLQSTQIDQGAQQVRRLGRIALFYHYQKTVKGMIAQTVKAVRQSDIDVSLGISEDGRKTLLVHNTGRLRVYIVCSICGGTGGGTFIDMAYLTRHIATSMGGVAQDSIDVIGVLLLPEAFPDLVTTGAARIRANAYASLLDLEYYNQATANKTKLYRVNLPEDPVEMDRNPFSLCYLVSASNRYRTLRNVDDLAPVVAEAMDTLIAGRVGEQLDATIDNIRPYLSVYYRGYRAFYSTFGISQIVYPRPWLRERFGSQLKRFLIENKVLCSPNDPTLDKTVAERYEKFNKAIDAQLRPDASILAHITRPLENVGREAEVLPAPQADLQNTYNNAVRTFQRDVADAIRGRVEPIFRKAERELEQEVLAVIDDSLTGDKGFHWALDWLRLFRVKLDDDVNTLSHDYQYFDPTAELNKQLAYINAAHRHILFGDRDLRQRVREAAEMLKREVLEQRALESVAHEAKIAVFNSLIRSIDRWQRSINQTLGFWNDQMQTEVAVKELQYTLVTQPVLNKDEREQHITKAILKCTGEQALSAFCQKVQQVMGSLSGSLDVEKRAQMLKALENLCHARYDEYEAEVKADVADLLRQKTSINPGLVNRMLTSMGERAQPLLGFSEGKLQSIPPRQIKIIGVNIMQDGQNLIKPAVGEPSDLTVVETYDPASITFLVTHHGIPINALTKFGEYQRQYQKFVKSDPLATFHLDNERENEPHDPGSMHFINLNDFEAYFARALAYGWIVRLENGQTGAPAGSQPAVFALRADFYEALSQRFAAEMTRIGNKIDRLQNPSQSPGAGDDDEGLSEYQLDVLTQLSTELQQQFKLFEIKVSGESTNPAEKLNGFKAHWPRLFAKNRTGRLITTQRGRTVVFPASLDDVLDALFGGPVRAIAGLFLQAFDKHYDWSRKHNLFELDNDWLPSFQTEQMKSNPVKAERALIVKFLEDRTVNNDWWSQPGQASRDVEQQLCAMLRVFLRNMTKADYAERLPVGYLRDLGEEILPEESNGSWQDEQ